MCVQIANKKDVPGLRLIAIKRAIHKALEESIFPEESKNKEKIYKC